MPESRAPGGARNPDLLTVYCNDHLAAATGGVELVTRMLGHHRGGPHDDALAQLLDELREERAALLTTMRALGVPVREYKQAVTWAAEKLGRFKLNGRLFTRSPLSDLVEWEFIATAVVAKRAGFETLRALGEVDRRVDVELFERLIHQADRQHHWLVVVRREVAASVLGGRAGTAAGDADA
ncbi:hypothetical protein ACI79P_11340 [Blastococcus sp. SYSU DS0510]